MKVKKTRYPAYSKRKNCKNLQHMGMALEQISLALNVSVQVIQEWLATDYALIK